MGRSELVLMTDHGSTEGSREALATAVRRLTGRAPVLLDARHFMSGGPAGPPGAGRVCGTGDGVVLEVPAEGLAVPARTVILYEIPPHRRLELADCQRALREHGVRSLGTAVDGWRAASDKRLTVEALARHGVRQMPTVTLSRPTAAEAAEVFDRLGGDVWARPAVGMSGQDVFHVTTRARLAEAAECYARAGADWLLARDARNFTADGRGRHQYRVTVLGGRALRAVEHVQDDPDEPCNLARGAVSTPLSPTELPAGLAELAVAATGAVGLPFAAVDLAAESGGVVFEVNVHPAFGSPGAVEAVAVPYVAAHLDPEGQSSFQVANMT
ncbi:RimK family alpha-L-glutamate ligase [Kitasatospora sp. NPDC057692]|uniref:ATP-grasp domain-containing protein n=1 Tax=Kitasatospora sp. NPDC057692 TaxID=3346215 RepID=UPI0036AB0FA2